MPFDIGSLESGMAIGDRMTSTDLGTMESLAVTLHIQELLLIELLQRIPERHADSIKSCLRSSVQEWLESPGLNDSSPVRSLATAQLTTLLGSLGRPDAASSSLRKPRG
jgi:hypothetical protein